MKIFIIFTLVGAVSSYGYSGMNGYGYGNVGGARMGGGYSGYALGYGIPYSDGGYHHYGSAGPHGSVQSGGSYGTMGGPGYTSSSGVYGTMSAGPAENYMPAGLVAHMGGPGAHIRHVGNTLPRVYNYFGNRR
ncbi:uncharacterized protein LOC141911350 [Tubulanus polymorphus]|uniref:uncharacterized protein LOC141911350 n=1 Tax=Tubulanus polymorphus TaxID=672921 RepID=UPI003DA6259B